MPKGEPGKWTVAESIKSKLPDILCIFLLVLTFFPATAHLLLQDPTFKINTPSP